MRPWGIELDPPPSLKRSRSLCRTGNTASVTLHMDNKSWVALGKDHQLALSARQPRI